MPISQRGAATSTFARLFGRPSQPPISNFLRGFRADAGFTLIELLVVILIIGILAGVAIPVFLNQTSKANDANAKANLSTLNLAVASCYAQTQDYSQCQTQSALPGDTFQWGTGSGQTEVFYSAPSGSTPGFILTVAGSSDGAEFGTMKSLPDQTDYRVCQVPGGQSYPFGGCKAGGPYASMGYGTW